MLYASQCLIQHSSRNYRCIEETSTTSSSHDFSGSRVTQGGKTCVPYTSLIILPLIVLHFQYRNIISDYLMVQQIVDHLKQCNLYTQFPLVSFINYLFIRLIHFNPGVQNELQYHRPEL